MIEKIIEDYKDLALDPSQPFFQVVYNLHKQYPNNMEFGQEVRVLLMKIEDHLRNKTMENSQEQLEKLITNNKSS
jgi:hypothetical protein